jgi:hypothetical protein
LLSKTYFAGGMQYRRVGRIRTGTEYSNADGTTDYTEIAASAQKKNQFGITVGIGMRFIDQVGIRVAPEIRYTRWVGATFQGTSYRSVSNQLEAGFGLSF